MTQRDTITVHEGGVVGALKAECCGKYHVWAGFRDVRSGDICGCGQRRWIDAHSEPIDALDLDALASETWARVRTADARTEIETDGIAIIRAALDRAREGR